MTEQLQLSFESDGVMAQWERLKRQHPDTLLFFKLGDFYEAFGEDAEIVARECEMTLTRHRGTPMCGMMCVRAETYLDVLAKRGYRCATVTRCGA